MRSSQTTDDVLQGGSARGVDGATGLHHVLRELFMAHQAADAVDLLRRGASVLGASSSCFISFVREGDAAATCRMLLACDPRWGSDYLAHRWFDTDPWLSHAMRTEEPVLASQLLEDTPAERAMVDGAARYGFTSVLVAPAPSAAGAARVGVLYLGSHRVGFFEQGDFAGVRSLAQALAMELHAWWLRSLRRELVSRIRLSDDELNLLRQEEAGHCSKTIARVLGTPSTTIDCRFQRINAKLGAPNRRAAVKIARLYGLL